MEKSMHVLRLDNTDIAIALDECILYMQIEVLGHLLVGTGIISRETSIICTDSQFEALTTINQLLLANSPSLTPSETV